MIYPSFEAFYESVIQPLRAANPDHGRLDGQLSGGNFDVVGRFRYQGRPWKVHADTHYEPLDIAYRAPTGSPPRDPFLFTPTKTGLRLDLADDLQRRRRTRFRHLYVYSDP
ncbi:MAG: hypothetical protein H0X65_12740 [Gemmatimonadetes bacterium]|jgi:hypothetical protein|nr:hypothetical protein [Gemmatimonadota bacterium]